MFKDIETQAVIIGCGKIEITDEKTGEVTNLTKIIVALPDEDTENYVGGAVLELYSNSKAFENVSKNVFTKVPRLVRVIIEQKPLKNGAKYKLKKINDIEL